MGIDNEQKNIKGIKIQTLNYVMIFVSFISFIVVILETVVMQAQYDDLISVTESYLESENYTTQFSDASDYLSEKARLYVINGDKKYADDYFEELNVARRRESALTGVVNLDTDENAQSEMEHVKEKADRLTERETYAMRLAAEARNVSPENMDERVRSVVLSESDAKLTGEEKLSEAQEMVFGSVYQNERKYISGYIVKFIDRQVSVIKQKQKSSAEELSSALKRQTLFISLLFIMNIAIFVIILNLIIRPLKIYMHCIKDGEMLKIAGAYEFKYLALTYNSIYEINAANEQMLKHKAEHDSLTGLVNRGAFDNFAMLCRRENTHLALLIIDVDKFKQINDKYGHTTGDAVLQRLAKLLKVHFRSSDCVARVGGDEFCVIMMDASPESKDNITKKINSINNLLKESDDGLPYVSISTGVAFSDNGYTENLYPQADSALYYVKEHGRGGLAFYDESMPIKS